MPIALGRVYDWLGDFEEARGRLEPALAAVEAGGLLWLAPSAHLALGELEYASGNAGAARAHFEKASAFWTDDLPDAASVEARCYLASLAPQGQAASATMEMSIEQARKMGRLSSEMRCRLLQARVQSSRGRSAEALETLDRIPLEGDRTVGKEMQALARYGRSLAMAARGNRPDADAEAAIARMLVLELRATMPVRYRERFASRREIRQIIGDSSIGERQ